MKGYLINFERMDLISFEIVKPVDWIVLEPVKQIPPLSTEVNLLLAGIEARLSCFVALAPLIEFYFKKIFLNS